MALNLQRKVKKGDCLEDIQKIKAKIEWLLENFSQSEIAKETNVPQSTLSYLKKGTRKIRNLSVGTVQELIQFYDRHHKDKE